MGSDSGVIEFLSPGISCKVEERSHAEKLRRARREGGNESSTPATRVAPLGRDSGRFFLRHDQLL